MLDVEEEERTALYAMNASDLLAILESSVRSEDNIETMTQHSQMTVRAGAIDGKGTGFGTMFRSTIHDSWEKRSKKNETNSITGSTSSSEQLEWKAIEKKTSIWRRANLETKLYLNAEFGQLRSKHLQEGYPSRGVNTTDGQREPFPCLVQSENQQARDIRRYPRFGEGSIVTTSTDDSDFGFGGSSSSVPPTLDNEDWRMLTRNPGESSGPQASSRSEGKQSHRSPR